MDAFILQNLYFKIVLRLATIPVTYKLKDMKDELIKGSFYEYDLQRLRPINDYQIDIIRARVRNGKKQYLVHYRGWPDNFDEWIPANQLKSL